MGEVVDGPFITRLDIPVERVLRHALDKAALKSVVIAGYDEDGNEYFSSSIADGGDILWLMERLKQQLLNVEIP